MAVNSTGFVVVQQHVDWENTLTVESTGQTTGCVQSFTESLFFFLLICIHSDGMCEFDCVCTVTCALCVCIGADIGSVQQHVD